MALIEQARSFPGFDRFMLNDAFSALSMAAQTAPVLILLATPTFCGALLIRSPSTSSEQLCFSPNLEARDVKRLHTSLQVANGRSHGMVNGRAMKKMHTQRHDTKAILEQLWHSIVEVILQFLSWKVS